ncbi:MAG: hypothetical protein ACW99A_08830 [Candidatus Kariarchaeaceae archaeon]|jgi:hypothetical protein
MSIKERPRERKEVQKKKKEDAESINDWLDSVEVTTETEEKNDIVEIKEEIVEETKVTEAPIQKEIEKEVQITEKEETIDIFLVKLPPWVKKPWMYVKPVNEAQLNSWLDSWKGLVIEYARSYKIHVINLSQLNTKHPFANQEIDKTLTYDQLQSIVDHMVIEGLAKWIDDTRVSARIYYLTNKQWGNKIMEYMIESGYAAEIMTFFELQQLKQEWSTLPRTELKDIFEILVMEGRAKWVGDEKDTLSFIL